MSTAQIAWDFTRVYAAGSLGPTGSGSTTSLGIDGQAPARGQRYEDKFGNVYKFVLNSGTIATIGDVACHDYSTAGESVVKQTTTGALDSLAGVWLGAAPASGYGWIQIKGFNAAINALGNVAIVIGDSLKGVNAQAYVVHDTAQGTAATYYNNIRALSAYAVNAPALITGSINCDRN